MDGQAKGRVKGVDGRKGYVKGKGKAMKGAGTKGSGKSGEPKGGHPGGQHS